MYSIFRPDTDTGIFLVEQEQWKFSIECIEDSLPFKF